MRASRNNHRTRSLALATGGLTAMAVGMGIGRFVYTPILPAMIEGLGLTTSKAGLIASANFLGYLAGALLAASPFLAGSRRVWLLAALLVGAATTGAMGLASSTPAFVALRFTGGAASALILIFASALVLDGLAQMNRSGMAALHFAGVGIGIALSAALVSGLLALGTDWRPLWFACGAVSLLAVPAVARLIPAGDPARTNATSPGTAATPKPGLVALVLAYGLFGFGYVVTATFLVAIVRAAPAVRAVEPWIWGVVGLTAAPSVAFWTAIAKRLGISRTFAGACLVEAVGVAASVLWPTRVGALLAAATLGGTFMGITALGLAGARRLATGDPRRALSLLTASFGIGQIAGPSAAGFLYNYTGGFTVPSLLAVAALIAAATVVTLVRLPPDPKPATGQGSETCAD